MALKTEKTQKLIKGKRYYTEFGKIKYWNIINDLVLVIVLPIFLFVLLEVIFFMLNFGYDFSYLKIDNFIILTQNILKNFWDLKNGDVFEKVFFYYITGVFTFLVLFFVYLIYQIKKANILSKLSSLGLEGYKLKKRKDGLLFIVRRGEELDLKKFQDENLENIRQVFNKFFKEDDEIVVERYKNRGFYLKKVKLQVPNFSFKMLKKGKVYFGKGLKNGDIYLKIGDLTHFLIVGQSGAGKSVFQNLLINQFIYNLQTENGVQELYLVDLKGGVEFLQYSRFKGVNVVTDVPQLLQLSRDLIVLMDERYQEMIKKGWKNWRGGQIVVLIDEYASINDQAGLLEKDEEKELKNNLRTLLAKSRAAGIKFIVATQKATSDSIDTTLRENLQSKILMRTISKDAQRVVIPKEQLEELGVEPARFTKGRFVLFSEKILDLVQSPFIREDFYKEIEKLRKDLLQTDNRIYKTDNDFLQNNLSCCEVEAQDLVFSDGEIERGEDKNENPGAETSNNKLPQQEEAIKLRKEMYKLTSRIVDKEKRKNIRALIRKIKEEQEQGIFSYSLNDLKAMKEVIESEINAEAERPKAK